MVSRCCIPNLLCREKLFGKLPDLRNWRSGRIGHGKEEEEDVKKLLEPFSKEQLMDIIFKNAKKDPQLLESIQKLADKDPVHRKVFVGGLGWDTMMEALK